MVTDLSGRAQGPSPTAWAGRLIGWLFLMVLGVGSAFAQCPPAESIDSELRELDLAAAYRTRELGQEPPWKLYRKAARRPGKVAVATDGNLGRAVLISELPIETLWMAINDEDHYAEDGFLPVEHSEVIGGASRGQQRLLFQYFRRAGVGRWWIDEVVMNRELFEESEGMLWELQWWDLMETYAESGLPADHSDLDLVPIEESRGAWLLIPIADRCTLIEYATVSKPGGVLNVANLLGSGLVIRETLEGTERLAREHIPEPHPDAEFVRPDGSAIAVPTL